MPLWSELKGLSDGREAVIAFDATIKEYLKEIDEASLLTVEESPKKMTPRPESD